MPSALRARSPSSSRTGTSGYTAGGPTAVRDSNPSDGKTESWRGKVCTRGNNLSGAKCANVTDRWISPDYTGDGDFGDDIAVMKIDQPLGQANWIAMSSASNSVIDDYAMYNGCSSFVTT